jgi:hypothetical protein
MLWPSSLCLWAWASCIRCSAPFQPLQPASESLVFRMTWLLCPFFDLGFMLNCEFDGSGVKDVFECLRFRGACCGSCSDCVRIK